METGSEPETWPQKSNYRSSREGVGPAPRHSFIQHKALPDMQSQAHIHTCDLRKTSDEQKTEMDKNRRSWVKVKTEKKHEVGVFVNWGHLIQNIPMLYSPTCFQSYILFWSKTVPLTAWPETKAVTPGLRSV